MTFFAWFSSLRVRVLFLVALAMLPGLVVTIYTAMRWREHEVEDAKEDALRLARHATVLYRRMIDDSRGALFGLSQLAAAFQGRPEDFRVLLAACLEEHPGYEIIRVVAPDGSVTMQVGGAEQSPTPVVAERAFFTRAIATKGFAVGDYEVDLRASRASVTLAYPVIRPNGETVEVLAATVELAWLRELATKALLPPGTTVTVFDERGIVFMGMPAGGDGARAGGLPRAQLHALAAGGERTGELKTLDGVVRQFAVAPMLTSARDGRLFVMIAIPTAVATARADAILFNGLGTIGLAILLTAAVGWVGSEFFILRQTRALVSAAARVSQGDLTARSGVRHGAGELNQLAEGFDEMAAALQRRAEKILIQNRALNHQARRFRALIEESSDGILLLDERGALRYVSPSTTRLLGYPPQEILGCEGMTLIHPDDREFAAARFAEVLRRPGQHLRGVFRVRRRDGAWRWIESTVTNLMDEPAVRAIVSNYRDVTEGREAADSLLRAHDELEMRVEARTADLSRANAALQAEIGERRRTEEVLHKFSQAIEQTDDSVFIANRRGVIEYVNRAFQVLTGYSASEAVGATPHLLSSGGHDRAFYEALWQTVLSGRVFRSVFLNKTRDGRLYYEDQTITPIQNEVGEVTHFVSTGRDITRRKRTEEALRRLNEQLEGEATRIAAALHDEAAQFLTASHITIAEVARELPAAARERLVSVRRNLDQVEEQLRRLAHELRPRILDDLGLVEALKFLADGVSRRSGVEVTVAASLKRRCPPAVETALYRLVQEALTNMTKHAGASRGTVALRETADAVHCSVADDGRGFDVPAVLGRSGDSSLGLIGIQDRLEAVGGLLQIVSAPECGTELIATIPLES